jgi:hypothetical protein
MTEDDEILSQLRSPPAPSEYVPMSAIGLEEYEMDDQRDRRWREGGRIEKLGSDTLLC